MRDHGRIWAVRSLLRLAIPVCASVGVAVAFAAVEAPLRGDGFADGFRLGCYLIGAFLLVMGAIGGSSVARATNARSSTRMLGRIPGGGSLGSFAAAREGEPTLTATATFLFGGALVIAIGLLV